MSSWFEYLWPPTPSIVPQTDQPELGLDETWVDVKKEVIAPTPTPLQKMPCMVFPGGAITFIPRKCSACKEYRNRHCYTFIQWKKPEGTGRCIKCT